MTKKMINCTHLQLLTQVRRQAAGQWDQDEEEYREGTGSMERLELRCLAQFGRPSPTITWYINRDQNNDLSGERLFTIREQNGNSHDPNAYIRDWQSDIDFEVGTEFLNYLANSHGINVNPENGQFSFDLTCHASQVGNVSHIPKAPFATLF